MARLTGQKTRHAIYDPRLLVPGPVPGFLDDLDLCRTTHGLAVRVGEVRLEIWVLRAPHDQRRRRDLPEVAPDLGQLILRRRAVQAQDRALRAVVEVLP